jgi:hypothetical protein
MIAPIFSNNGKTGKIIDENENEDEETVNEATKTVSIQNNITYDCIKCGKIYTSHSGLYKHTKKCGLNINESIKIMKLQHELELEKKEMEKKEIEMEKKEIEMEKKELTLKLEFERKEKELLLKQVEKKLQKS